MGDNLRRLHGEAGLSWGKLSVEPQRRSCDNDQTTFATKLAN